LTSIKEMLIVDMIFNALLMMDLHVFQISARKLFNFIVLISFLVMHKFACLVANQLIIGIAFNVVSKKRINSFKKNIFFSKFDFKLQN